MSDYQDFWRCAHHPSAIDNFFAHRAVCAHGCREHPLRWYHNGTRPRGQRRFNSVGGERPDHALGGID